MMNSHQIPLAGLTPVHQLPTNLTSSRHPVHRWYNFIAGFSPEFVAECIASQRKEGLFSEMVLLDPFAGCATSLVEANLHGIDSVGYESHPFFADIASAKLSFPVDPSLCDTLEVLADRAIRQPASPDLVWEKAALEYLQKLVPAEELATLAACSLLGNQISASMRPVYLMAISQVLELCCSSQTDGIYKTPTTLKSSIPFQVGFRRVIDRLRADINIIKATWTNQARVIRHTSEDMGELSPGSCTLCVTSPPYLNNFDFAEMTRMELYFWRYASNWREITERIRRALVINTTTAPSDMKSSQKHFRTMVPQPLLGILDDIVALLEERRKYKAGKKDYHQLIFPYFGQMTRVLAETHRVLESRGRIFMVVADSALYGVHIDTEAILSQIMRNIGFHEVNIRCLRQRGHRWVLGKRQGPPGGLLREYCIEAVRV